MLSHFKSPVAGGIVLGFSFSCIWIVPLVIATFTDHVAEVFTGGSFVALVVVAIVAEYRARKKAG